MVLLLSTNGVSTFDDYASDVFIPYIKKQLETSIRVDVVWDTYVTCSIKESTDAILIIVGKFCDLLQQHPAADIWLAFGTGTKFRHIHVNAMYNVLGIEKSIVLPVLLAVIQLPHFLGKKSQHRMLGNHSQR